MNKFENNIQKIPDTVPEKSVEGIYPKKQENHELNLSPEEIERQETEDKQRLRQVIEDIKNHPEQNKIPEMPTNKQFPQKEQVEMKGKIYTVEYVPKENIYPAFGYAGGKDAIVREDLSPRVKKFIRAHELYHCKDESDFGGWIGREIRANIIPGLKDPVGLLATIKASLTKDRIKFYWERFKRGQ